MSIEQTFERIATALERLADAQEKVIGTITRPGATVDVTPAAENPEPQPAKKTKAVKAAERASALSDDIEAAVQSSDSDLNDLTAAPQVDYEAVKVAAVKLGEAKGKEALVKLLKDKFKLAEGQKVSALKESQYPDFISEVNALLDE